MAEVTQVTDTTPELNDGDVVEETKFPERTNLRFDRSKKQRRL